MATHRVHRLRNADKLQQTVQTECHVTYTIVLVDLVNWKSKLTCDLETSYP